MTIYNENDWIVEPANVVSINCVTSINLANYARSSCSEPLSIEERPVYTDPRMQGISGNVLLKAGYNCDMSQRGNKIKIEAVNRMNDYIDSIKLDSISGIVKDASLANKLKTRGKFMKSRDEVPITTAEAIKINNGDSLDDCSSYDDLINSINGIAGPYINIKGGVGIDISVDPEDEHTLRIRLDTQHLKDGCEINYPDKVSDSTDL